MHVCIDYRPALHEATGVGTYVRGLTEALARSYPSDRFIAFSASFKHRLAIPFESESLRIADVRVPVKALDWCWHKLGWPPVERFVGEVDLTHSPSPLLLPARRGARRVVTVHDCYFLRHPEDVSGVVRRDYVPLARRSILEADAVVVVSETTRDELLELVEVPAERVHVTYNGLENSFIDPDPGASELARSRLGTERPYLLFVGRREARKDMPTLLAAFDSVHRACPQVELLLAGPDGQGWSEAWSAATPEVRAHTRLLPHQPMEVLAGLYAGALALVLPSHWEGFGLTAVEAMSCGTAVIASRAGALPEVLGDAPSFFEAGDAGGLANAVLRLIEDPRYRESRSRAGVERASRYRWDHTARLTHQLYQRLLT